MKNMLVMLFSLNRVLVSGEVVVFFGVVKLCVFMFMMVWFGMNLRVVGFGVVLVLISIRFMWVGRGGVLICMFC